MCFSTGSTSKCYLSKPTCAAGALGSRLLAEAERQAVELGAKNAKLDTFEWQAPALYQKHGYEVYARVDDYAPGFYLASMKKSLAG